MCCAVILFSLGSGFPVGLQHGQVERLVVGLRFRELGPLVVGQGISSNQTHAISELH